MKRYYLSYNEITGEHYLDSGAFSSDRAYLGKEEDFLINYLKKNINKKKKSELYVLQEGFDKGLLRKIRVFFSGTKVGVKLDPISKYLK